MEKFVAIDFETSKGKHACSIGIVEFENGKVKSEYYSLIKPYDLEFGYYNMKIHGISSLDVANEKTFNLIWNDIKHYFNGTKIVAHNYSTDISVLKYNLGLYGLEMPFFDVYCTLRLSRKLIALKSYKLSEVAKYFGIRQVNYHNALEDSLICGEIMNKLYIDFKDCVLPVNIKSNKKENKRDTSKHKSILVEKSNIPYSNTNGKASILGKVFVVSGVFHKVTRNELKKLIEDNSGKVSSSISKKTDYIVAGDNMGPAKLQKATDLGVSIISEDDFLAMVS